MQDSSFLYPLGRFRGYNNQCYANAAIQCLLSWKPFLKVMSSAPSNSADGISDDKCLMGRMRKLRSDFLSHAPCRSVSDVSDFLRRVCAIKGSSLRVGEMEDPRDFLVALWDAMSFAGCVSAEQCSELCLCKGCVVQCGHFCRHTRIHVALVALSVDVAFEYECVKCKYKFIRPDSAHEWCIRLPMSYASSYTVSTLLSLHVIDGVCERMETTPCGCSNGCADGCGVQVRHSFEGTMACRGSGFVIYANSVYVDQNNVRRKHLDRYCMPSLYIELSSNLYRLDSFIEHRVIFGDSADGGHYVVYIRESEDGQVWRHADDGCETVMTWDEVSRVKGHMFFYLK